MNLTMELRSPSSMFLRIDMERYPVEISMYVAGAVAFSAPSVCSSASSHVIVVQDQSLDRM